MKSLVEEASSIAKAIEKAWERAGKPQAFSVKIYETGEKNFLGFTKKSAKVGIFFEEEIARSNDRRPHGQNNRPQNKPHQNNSYTDRLARGAEKTEKSERPVRNNSSESIKQTTRPTQQARPSRPAYEERPEVTHAQKSEPRSEERQEPRERYVREGNDRPRRDNRRTERPERRNDERRTQRPSHQNDVERKHREPLVQPYPHSESSEVEKQIPAQQTTPQTDRPVMAIPVAQTQRKVLKVSSRRYTANKPTSNEEPKKAE